LIVHHAVPAGINPMADIPPVSVRLRSVARPPPGSDILRPATPAQGTVRR
jgi:hypothetical protein